MLNETPGFPRSLFALHYQNEKKIDPEPEERNSYGEEQEDSIRRRLRGPRKSMVRFLDFIHIESESRNSVYSHDSPLHLLFLYFSSDMIR